MGFLADRSNRKIGSRRGEWGGGGWQEWLRPGLPSCVGNTWYILPRWWKRPSAQSSWPPWPFDVAQSFSRAFHHFEVLSLYADFICLQPGCPGNKLNLRKPWIIIYFILQNLQRTLIQRRYLRNVCHTHIEITSFWGCEVFVFPHRE